MHCEPCIFRHYILRSRTPSPPGVQSDFTLRTDNQVVTWLRIKREVNVSWPIDYIVFFFFF